MLLPSKNQRILTRDGEVWLVRALRKDLFNPDDLTIELVSSDAENDLLAPGLMIDAPNWALWCSVNGVLAVEDEPDR